jgi:peptide/nickel transport system substrate-binding protein
MRPAEESHVTAIFRRAFVGAAGAVVLAPSLSGIARAQAKNRLVIGMSLEPPVLDPTKNAAAAIREVTTPTIYESLGRIDRTGAIGPGLAESWSISEDGKEYVFKLRPNVRYHDGEPLDASVVKFSLDRLFAPDSTVPAKSLYTDIEKVEVVDPLTVRLTLKSPNSFLLYSLSLGDAGIQHPKSAPTNDKRPIGTGPFMFKERKEGDSITLVRSPTYRDPDSIKLDTVIFRMVKDPSAQVSALLAGDIDAFPGFQAPELVERLRKDPRFTVVVGTTEGEVILATNNARKPFTDPKVRQAIAHAIDREELISAESGFGVPIGSHFAPHNKAYVDLTKTYPLDLAKAKKLLAEAGYPNGLEATLKLPPVGYAQRAGEVIASQLGKIGVKLSITQLQWPQWLAEVFKERNYDLTIVAHTEANDLDRYARNGYYWGYDSPDFKAKWREVVSATDFARRDQLLQEAQRIISRDAVNGFLFQLAKIGVWKKDLVGLWENSPTPQLDLTGVHWK